MSETASQPRSNGRDEPNGASCGISLATMNAKAALASRAAAKMALGSLRRVLVVGGPIALLLAALAAYGVATAALRPVNAMRAEAAAPT